MISILICTYNRERYIMQVLDALQQQMQHSDDVELILIDNNSTDNTKKLLSKFKDAHPQLQISIFNEQKQGLSHARNRGIAESNGDFLVFLDDDAIPQLNYIENIKNLCSEQRTCWAFGGKIEALFEDGITPKWYTSWTRGWVSALDMGKKTRLFKKGKFPIGANMGFSRKIFNECGAFKPELGRNGGNMMAGEEKDLFNRIRAKGYPIIYEPNIVVKHVIPTTRTTKEYVIRFAKGVGTSERIRSKQEGTFLSRSLNELVKWAATLVLSAYYCITLKPQVAKYLITFRTHVTKNLFSKKQTKKTI